MSTAITRRRLLKSTGLAAAGTLAAPYVRGAHAAGKLSVGFWDHWVPGSNDTLTKIAQEWAAKEKVELTIDYIPSQGNKLLLTTAAEAQAGSGHDILSINTWLPGSYADKLEPVDDVMKEVLAQNGPTNPVVEYLGKIGGHWRGVPQTPGSQIKGPCSRIDLLKQHAGFDVQAIYPVDGPVNAAAAEGWTWEALVGIAEKCMKGGFPVGLGLGTTSDNVDTWGAMFNAYGAKLVDEKGNITVNSDATRQALELAKRLAAFMPPDAIAWDDSSNNRWLISGKGSMIFNPPSTWAVAKRDAPQVAEQCWTHGAPKGPAGRFGPYLPYYWGTWAFSKNKSAAKSLLTHLSTRSAAEAFVAASQGYDIPAYLAFNDFKTWAEEGPPRGTLRHYPNEGDQILSIAAAPAPHKIAEQIYNQATITKMIAGIIQGGDSIDKAISKAESELEGFMRG